MAATSVSSVRRGGRAQGLMVAAGHPWRREPGGSICGRPAGGAARLAAAPDTPGCTAGIGFAAYDGRGRGGYRRIMYSTAAAPDLKLPLIRRLAAHQFTGAQLAALDAVALALVVVATEVLMTPRAPRVSGTAWDAAGLSAYLVAAVATLGRRRA